MNEITVIQKQFGDHLLNFIKGKVSSAADAEDIYQDVVYKIITKSGQLSKAASMKSWLFTIAKNQIIDYYRVRKNKTQLELVSDMAFAEEAPTNSYGGLEGCLSGFIEVLPEDYRQVIQLSEIEGKSQKEVAESLGLNYVTLRSKVQRGRERIKKMIQEACVIEQDGVGRVVECTPNANSSVCHNPKRKCN